MRAAKHKTVKERTQAGTALDSLIVQLFHTHAALQAAAAGVTQDSRITSSRWQIMGAIRNGGKTAAQLGRDLGLSRQITLWNAQFLADEGLVAFEENPDHQRAYLISLTADGREILDRLTHNQIQWVNGLASGFDLAKLEAAHETLKQLAEALR